MVSIRKLVNIAEIEDEVLLGADILLMDDGGPVDILLSEGRMILRRVSVPIE